MENKLTQTKQLEAYREKFGAVVPTITIEGFDYVGRTEKGFLFTNAENHGVTVSVTAHKYEATSKTPAFDPLEALEAYQDKQDEKAKKKAEADEKKAKKLAEKEKKEE